MFINTTLHYASLQLESDFEKLMSTESISVGDFDYLNELIGFVLAEASYDCVHLICIDNNVFVSHTISEICRYIESYSKLLHEIDNIFWQEYSSYEEAYKVALLMQETSPFCYED